MFRAQRITATQCCNFIHPNNALLSTKYTQVRFYYFERLIFIIYSSYSSIFLGMLLGVLAAMVVASG